MKRIIEFLSDLKENNNREWFQENKHRYEEAKDIFTDLMTAMIHEIRQFDPSIGEIDPQKTIFRIYRDVRFSKDKSPYKTNIGGFISPDGRKGNKAGYYLHIEPGKSFAGGGIYQPEKNTLMAIRSHIYRNPDAFLSIVDSPSFKNILGELWNDKLKRPPKGFDPEFEHVELLKYKSFVVAKEFNNSELYDKAFFAKCLTVFKEMYPLNRFLNDSF